MSTRYEYADAASTNVTVAGAGDLVDRWRVPGGELALVLEHNEVFILSGKPGDLLVLLERARQQVVANL